LSTKKPVPYIASIHVVSYGATLTYSVFIPDTDGVGVNVTTPVPGAYPPTVQLLTCVLDVFRYTAMFSARSADVPAPLSVSVCASSAIPTLMLAHSSEVCVTISGAGNAALRLFVIEANVIVNVPVAVVAAGANVNATCDVSDAAVTEPGGSTVPDDAETLYAVPVAMAVSVVAVMLVAAPTAKAGCEKLTVAGNLYPCIAKLSRARVCAMTSVAVTDPVVEPAYVVESANAPCAVKLPVVPNVRPGPVIASITELTWLPAAKPARASVPLSAYGTLTADPSTTAYIELAIVVAVHPTGVPMTEMPLVVRVVVYPSGAVTTTENATEPEPGLVYVPSDTEWDKTSYVYEPIVPADAETELVLTSVVFVVVAS
jgi:hypothetical protein